MSLLDSMRSLLNKEVLDDFKKDLATYENLASFFKTCFLDKKGDGALKQTC